MKCVFTFLSLAAVILAGCIGIRQQSVVEGACDAHLLLCNDRYLLVQFGWRDTPNRYRILTQDSYVQSPSGKRYNIQVEPHLFDFQEKHPYVRDDVYPCDLDGSRIRRWSNGIWSVHLVVQSNGQPAVIDQKLKFWTFHYNPILHGPPN